MTLTLSKIFKEFLAFRNRLDAKFGTTCKQRSEIFLFLCSILKCNKLTKLCHGLFGY